MMFLPELPISVTSDNPENTADLQRDGERNGVVFQTQRGKKRDSDLNPYMAYPDGAIRYDI